MHCVWATKERRPMIKTDLQQRLWPSLGGIARENKMKALAIGGLKTMCTRFCPFRRHSQSQNPSNFSKATRQSGSMLWFAVQADF
jgi:hypothetical protein